LPIDFRKGLLQHLAALRVSGRFELMKKVFASQQEPFALAVAFALRWSQVRVWRVFLLRSFLLLLFY
jgi:hypothetical protein